MYTLNMNGLVQCQTGGTVACAPPLPHSIRLDVPNISADLNGMVYINIINRRGSNCRYRFSDNLAFVVIDSYTFDYNNLEGGRKCDDIVRLCLGNECIYVKRKNIKGEYLIDRLTGIGVIFHLDAPKTKRSEALNQMVNRTLQFNGSEYINDKTVWDSLEKRCEY